MISTTSVFSCSSIVSAQQLYTQEFSLNSPHEASPQDCGGVQPVIDSHLPYSLVSTADP